MEIFRERLEAGSSSGGIRISGCTSLLAGRASLSCPVLLIWPVYRAGSVMSIAPTPLPMWMDRPLSQTSVHTYNEWRKGRACYGRCATHTPTHKHLRVSLHMCPPHACLGRCGQTWDPGPGGNDRFRGCCGRRLAYGGYVWHVTCSGGVEWWHPLFNEQS